MARQSIIRSLTFSSVCGKVGWRDFTGLHFCQKLSLQTYGSIRLFLLPELMRQNRSLVLSCSSRSERSETVAKVWSAIKKATSGAEQGTVAGRLELYVTESQRAKCL